MATEPAAEKEGSARDGGCVVAASQTLRSGGSFARWVGWAVTIPVLILAWQIAAVKLDQPWLLPTVGAVGNQLLHPVRDLYASGSLAGNAAVSLVRVLFGFLLAAAVGVPLGLCMGTCRWVRGSIDPVIELLRPLCPIAWIPFAIAMFKLTTVPQLFGVHFSGTILDHVQIGMVFVLFWGAFFPILVNTVDGVSGVRRNYVALAGTLGADRRQTFLHVYLPAALPMIVTGLRQGIGTCWFVIIAAEMLPGANSGIGYLLMYAADQSGMDVVIAGMVVIGAVGAVLSAVIRRGTRRWTRWQGREV